MFFTAVLPKVMVLTTSDVIVGKGFAENLERAPPASEGNKQVRAESLPCKRE